MSSIYKSLSLGLLLLLSLSLLISCKTKVRQVESIDDDVCPSPYVTKRDTVHFKTFEL